jgi:hypothetical protein
MSTAQVSWPMQSLPKSAGSTDARGVKSIYFTTGLAEASETFFVFGVFCLWPGWFAPVAWVFAAICLYTALSRIIQARAVSAGTGLRGLTAPARNPLPDPRRPRCPTESRTMPGPIPSSSRASSERFLWVVVAGWVIRLLLSPRLLEIRTTSSAFCMAKQRFCHP